MAEEPKKDLDQVVRNLDSDVEDFEDLLDIFEEQNGKLKASVQSLGRQTAELRAEFTEMRELLESMSQRLDRLTAASAPRPDNTTF
jgi:chromosome segregation ATPase